MGPEPRCGTTAWVSYLSEHPSVYFAPVKEPHYFSTDFPDFRWVKTPEQYAALFTGASEAKIVAEASVQYLYSKEAAANIHRYNSDARILVFLRRQESFLPSYHNQLVYNRDETIPDFATAWRLALSAKERQIPATCREPSFLDYPAVGRFSEQLERYIALFPARQMMVIRFENWIAAPRETYIAILRFLGLEDDGRQDFQKVHRAKRHRLSPLSNLTQRPPAWVLGAAKLVKRFTGQERLRAADALRQLNMSQGYVSNIGEELRLELQDYFTSENIHLERLVSQLALATAK